MTRVILTSIIALILSVPANTDGITVAQSLEGRPSPRWGHAMAYDGTRDRVVLFGGALSRTEMAGDTWEWDGTLWTQIKSPGPSSRGYAAMAFDSRRGRVVLHGGRDEQRNALNDTWEWDGKSWQKVSDEGPAGRDHHAIVFDEARGVTVLFGGYDGSKVKGDTWQWDGRSWSLVHTNGPPPRAAFDMAYDAKRKTVILYGGLWLGGLYADIWEWDGRRWQSLAEPYANPTRDHHAAAYDAERDRYLIFGGKDYRFNAIGALFELRGAVLTEIARDGPSPRYNTPLVYNSRRKRMILFGGRIRKGDDFTAYGDTWIWDGTSWLEASTDKQ